MTSTIAPLEHKATPGAAPAIVDVDPGTGEVTALAAVTGVRDEVGDVIVPGALRRTLRERSPRLVVGHDWNRIAGRVTEARELMPGDPRLPRTAPDGTPWPRKAGALWIKARYVNTREGREQREVAREFGPDMAYSIGYKVTAGGAKRRGGVRYISDLDLFEVSPVLHGAARLATQLDIKSAAGALHTALHPLACGGCGRSAGGSSAPVPAGTVWLCPSCCGEVRELTGYLARTTSQAQPGAASGDGEPSDEDGALPDLDSLYAGWDEDPADDDAFLTTVVCGLCGAEVGRLGDIPADRDVICPDCVSSIDDLADRLAADAEPGPTAGQEYRDALRAEITLTMLADGTLLAEGAGNGGAGPRAFRAGAGGRARP